MSRLRATFVFVSFCGVLAHWALGAHFHYQFGGWPEVWRQEFYGFHHTTCLSCAVKRYVLDWLFVCAPFVVMGIGAFIFKSSQGIATLIILTVALVGFDIGSYVTTNSKDWFLLLSPFILILIAPGCLFIAGVVEKAYRPKEAASSDKSAST